MTRSSSIVEVGSVDASGLIQTLFEGLAETPMIDAHTHVDAAHLSARGLDDVLLYHMVVSELGSAGCPSRARVSEDPEPAEVRARLAEALPFIPAIRNTSCFWGIRLILRDLYGIDPPADAAGWWRVDAAIRERSGDPAWARDVLRRTGIRRASTELWRRRDGSADDVLQYALEWAFFARAQHGMNDAVIYELERTWSQGGPTAPLPVTLGGHRVPAERPIRTVEDVDAAVEHYVASIPYDRVMSTAQHISTDITFRAVTSADMAAALARRESATPADQDVYASYTLEAFLSALERTGRSLLFQFSVGAEPLPFETGSKMRQETIFEIAALAARHPTVGFQVFLASEHANQAFCTLARELPNVSLAGFWWHNLFPGIVQKVMRDRLDMLPLNKQVGFFSDAYCVEWSYAKAVIIRRQLAEVLAGKVAQGQYSVDEALDIAREILFVTPQTLNGLTPGRF
jgi:glucuronate isomerase